MPWWRDCGLDGATLRQPGPHPPPAPPPLPPPPRPTPAASLSATQASSLSSKPAAPQCTPSDLGYQCSRPLASGAVVHWSVGGGDAPPINACTRPPPLPSSYVPPGTAPSNGAATVAAAPLMHLAISSPLKGYVALGFSTKRGARVCSTHQQ